ncbi:MAG: hypothetical protein AAGC63_08810 [Propionicimonas sp.]|nr:hypothetical protein [Propionicimonas sp.]
MPHHIVIAHLAATLAPIAGVLAVIYAAAPSARKALRWPLAAASLLATVALVASGVAGHTLLDSVRATAPSAEYDAAFRHAKSSDSATTAAVVLAVLAPLAGWRFLRPTGPRHRFSTAAAVLLGLAGAALIATTAVTVADALTAAWAVTA